MTKFSARSGDHELTEVLLVRLVDDLPVPSYAHPGDAGFDLCSREDVTIPAGDRATVGTGVAIALPRGHVGLVHPRSGLAARAGITVLNAPGTIDAGFRGEIMVTLFNSDRMKSFRVLRGDRIAQVVVQAFSQVRFLEVDRLPGSHRGADGFGSTGGFSDSQPAPSALSLRPGAEGSQE